MSGHEKAEAAWQDPPPALRGLEFGTWTHHSIVDRLPETGQRALAENDFPVDIAGQIRNLIDEIPDERLKPIDDPAAPDHDDWLNYLTPYLEANWLEAPWFLVETYFYRRLIAITGYFEGGPEIWRDPFTFQKRSTLVEMAQEFKPPAGEQAMADSWLSTLWGNQADLSLWPTSGEAPGRPTPTPAQDRILGDERASLDRYLNEATDEIHRIDIILDNAGQELLADLALIHQLKRHLPHASIHLHAKAHPTFVSDATPADVLATLRALSQAGSDAGRALGQDILQATAAGSIQIHDHLYWTSPLAGWQMPSDLGGRLARSQLLIFKGDANYRRLLGDRHWPMSTPFAAVVSYLPAPSLAIRTLKSEVAVGLDEARAASARRQDPDWMTNGNWGMIQFFLPAQS